MAAADFHYIDSSQVSTPERPYYIGEWDFQMYAHDTWKAGPNKYPVQFRAVCNIRRGVLLVS